MSLVYCRTAAVRSVRLWPDLQYVVPGFGRTRKVFDMIWIGTSGYNYPEWKGSFYPPDLPVAKMLPYYATRFNTVEINYSFYRMPTTKLVTNWASQVPDHFRFTLKAPKRITHDRRLRDVAP